MRRLYYLAIALNLLACSADPDKPEQQARTLQPYAVHTLPLGVRLDSLQKILHGHSAVFEPVVPGRLFRIIPLNAYENYGYGAVELFPDSTIRTYYWYSDIDALTPEQQRYYASPKPAPDIKPVIAALNAAYGEGTKVEPYPEEAWYTWRKDSASLNLTLQKKALTLTKTGPTAPVVIDTSKPEIAAPVAKPKPKATAKKVAVKKQAVKKPVKKSTVKRSTAKKRTTTTKRR